MSKKDKTKEIGQEKIDQFRLKQLEQAVIRQAQVVEEQFEKITVLKKRLWKALGKKQLCLRKFKALKRKLKKFGLICSECEKILPNGKNIFCPYCGAKVKETEKNFLIKNLPLSKIIIKELEREGFKNLEDLRSCKNLQEINNIGPVRANIIKKVIRHL